MFRNLCGAITVVCLVAVLSGCGGGGEDGASGDQSASTQTSRPAPEEQSIAAIPPEAEKLDVLEGFEINPFFDEGGSTSELAVSPGERFSFFVFMQYEEPFHVAAIEYRIDLPTGVKIQSESKFNANALSVGDPLTDYALAFGCMAPGKYLVMTYTCLAEAEFVGGEIKMTPGLNQQSTLFLGMATCKPDEIKIPAKGGVAVLTKK